VVAVVSYIDYRFTIERPFYFQIKLGLDERIILK
jgi:hypothetical protein